MLCKGDHFTRLTNSAMPNKMNFTLGCVILFLLASLAVAQDCSSDPCEQSASCDEDDSGYFCYCPVFPAAYTGQNCELPITTRSSFFCSMNYNESIGNITSPFYPEDYTFGLECNYHLKIRTAKEITLVMLDFDTEPDRNVLIFGEGPEIIYRGPNVTSITRNLTGLPLIERTYTFTNSQIFLTFSSGRSTARFFITYTADIDSCMSSPCPDGLICKDEPYNYTCECPAGYTGEGCDINIDDCFFRPCENSGTCTDGINMYTCICAAGFLGEHCEIDIDECFSRPCENRGTCIDGINMYTCICEAGYLGEHCEIDIDECFSRPCENRGTCINGINMYTCICEAGYLGEHCEIVIGACGGNPCVHGDCPIRSCLCDLEYMGEICDTKRTCPNVTMETVFGQARLPMTEVGIIIDSEELCPEEDSEGPVTTIIRAVCHVSSNGTTYWNTSIRCQDDITRQLKRTLMSGINEANVKDVAEQVFTITKNYEDITATDICFLYEILQLIVDLNSDANVTGLIVGIVNNVMFVDEDVLASAQVNGSCTALIVQVLDSQLNTVDIGNSTLDAAYPNIAVQVLDVPSDTAGDGIVITMLSMDTGSLSNSDIMVGTHQDTPTDFVPRDTFARVVVPIEVGESAIKSLRVAFVVYANDAMFPSPNLNREIGTPVVSLTIDGQKIENLMERVNITFYRFKPDSREPTCNFWEFNLGKWSMEGCQLLPDNAVNSSNDEYYTCACDHLTNFAVLVDIYAEDDPPKPALRILSIIGCAISCVCLVIAIASFLSVKEKRQSQVYKIFICFCTTLLCLYTVSLAIIALDTEYQHAEVEWIPCTVLAALVHYFVLSSLTWMGIEGFHAYINIIKVFNTDIPRFMIKASIVGWGIPAVIVAATGAITRNYYAVADYCYIRKWPLIGSLLVPMAIILIINIAVFISAIRRLKKSSQMEVHGTPECKIKRQEDLERIQNFIATLILINVTWTTGYLALINLDYTEVLFIIFNSFQGFFIFVLYCLRKVTIRKQWRRCICCALLREGGGAESQESSGQTPRATSGTRGSQPMFESSSPIPHTNPSFEN